MWFPVYFVTVWLFQDRCKHLPVFRKKNFDGRLLFVHSTCIVASTTHKTQLSCLCTSTLLLSRLKSSAFILFMTKYGTTKSCQTQAYMHTHNYNRNKSNIQQNIAFVAVCVIYNAYQAVYLESGPDTIPFRFPSCSCAE